MIVSMLGRAAKLKHNLEFNRSSRPFSWQTYVCFFNGIFSFVDCFVKSGKTNPSRKPYLAPYVAASSVPLPYIRWRHSQLDQKSVLFGTKLEHFEL